MAIEKRQVSIMGSGFKPGAGQWIMRLQPGQSLRVEREPNNEYDKNAIAVWIFDQCLGYLPRGFVAEVAPLMDAGQTLTVTKSRDPRFELSGVVVVEWERPDDPSSEAAPEEQPFD